MRVSIQGSGIPHNGGLGKNQKTFGMAEGNYQEELDKGRNNSAARYTLSVT
jgi:hypothetical protein